MSPSRGGGLLFSYSRLLTPPPNIQYWQLRFQSSLRQIPNAKTQIYLSRSRSPYLNLSIEHHLLTKSPAESTILFLYTNSPSIIIGRNQNPWVECNLSLLRSSPLKPDLVRRRSGGGTVWHDEGNMNYSVICPTSKFDRDIHAQMVVRALRGLAVDGVRVNERHDIIMNSPAAAKPWKVSGSAYKLTRLRSVHHGTCLLNSPNLKDIGKFLRSPGKPYIKARGVDSVSSPIANVKVQNADFEDAVVKEFQEMYGRIDPILVGEEAGDVPEIMKGLKELKSRDWIYGQTPQFHFSYPTHPSSEALEEVGPTVSETLTPFNLSFIARNAAINSARLSQRPTSTQRILSLEHVKVHEIEDWSQYILPSRDETLVDAKSQTTDEHETFVKDLNRIFGVALVG
ncbi:hypothetical protein HYFRA_00009550 [Hymenoscyphus fraxineus]|uniref:Putative lipoate-protein ligase A n=1 Tax=Hymenoscyphus fraxineus TaxID=746836 RepID=A0A9N9PQB5_9HELO|nr:hypothetical protein HYFRA_00009550 [Hymenoscyphus fraxineus]